MHTLRQHPRAFAPGRALTDYKKTTCNDSIRSHVGTRYGAAMLTLRHNCPGPTSQTLIQAQFTTIRRRSNTLPFRDKPYLAVAEPFYCRV